MATLVHFCIFLFGLSLACGAAVTNATLKPGSSRLWGYRDFPNPLRYPRACGSSNRESFVCDPENVLVAGGVDKLNRIITQRSTSFRCTCKSQCEGYKDKYVIMVAVVRRVKVKDGATIEEKKRAVDDFATNLQKKYWAEGNCDNDIVIVLSTEYRRVYVSVGEWPSHLISDACIVDATSQVSKDYLKHDRYYDGLKSLLDKLINYIYMQIYVTCNKNVGQGGGTKKTNKGGGTKTSNKKKKEEDALSESIVYIAMGIIGGIIGCFVLNVFYYVKNGHTMCHSCRRRDPYRNYPPAAYVGGYSGRGGGGHHRRTGAGGIRSWDDDHGYSYSDRCDSGGGGGGGGDSGGGGCDSGGGDSGGGGGSDF